MDYPHILVRREQLQAARRPGHGGPRERPHHDSRSSFADELQSAADAVVAAATSRTVVSTAINPHLVFRIPVADSAASEEVSAFLEKHTTAVVVGVEADGAIVAFKDDVELDDFNNLVGGYRAGPKHGVNPNTGQPYKTTTYDVLDYLMPDAMRLWSRDDRIGVRLRDAMRQDSTVIDDSTMFVLDVELWHPGSAAVRRSLDELFEAIIASGGSPTSILDKYVGSDLVLARVRVPGSVVNNLLGLDAVAEMDFPPHPEIDMATLMSATSDSFNTPAPPSSDGPRLCVMDTGITANHPLLAPFVGHEESILTAEPSPSDENGHGTRVAGVAVFGDIRACVEAGEFQSPVVLYSARVLNADNSFDDERLLISQMREAVRAFKQAPYSCRIFNLSVCDRLPFTESDRGKQPAWAEALDILAREEEVLFVVSAGNQTQHQALVDAAPPSLEEILFCPESRLADPASAAIAVTVSGIVQHDVPAGRGGDPGNTIQRVTARSGEPSPFTRIGPGVSSAVKPEFAHYAGQHVIGGFDGVRSLRVDAGTAVVSLHHKPLERLLAWGVGTSYAAPRVARVAAIVEHQLKDLFGQDEIHPNVLRAVLAVSSVVPDATLQLEFAQNPYQRLKVVGYGIPDEQRALASDASRVTLIAEDELPLNNLHVYGLPNPSAFCKAPGARRISVAVAHDPPVRRRRSDYLGVELDFCVIRGMTPDEVFDAYSGADPSAKLSDLVPQRCHVAMSPGSTLRHGVARHRSTLQMATRESGGPDRNDWGSDMWLVIRSQNRWLSDDADAQKYAIAVSIESTDRALYQEVRSRVAQRATVRARARARV